MLALNYSEQLKFFFVTVSAVAIVILIGMHAAPIPPSP
jgi:hypothetical protein